MEKSRLGRFIYFGIYPIVFLILYTAQVIFLQNSTNYYPSPWIPVFLCIVIINSTVSIILSIFCKHLPCCIVGFIFSICNSWMLLIVGGYFFICLGFAMFITISVFFLVGELDGTSHWIFQINKFIRTTNFLNMKNIFKFSLIINAIAILVIIVFKGFANINHFILCCNSFTYFFLCFFPLYKFNSYE